MARPSNKRGFRVITVDDRRYGWRLNTITGLIEINLADAYTQRLEVCFGWYDPWLYQFNEEKPSASEPRVITPRFIESAICFALKMGWKPDAVAPAMSIRFNEGAFSLAGT